MKTAENRIIEHRNAAVDEHIAEDNGNQGSVIARHQHVDTPFDGGRTVFVGKNLRTAQREQ